MLSASSLHLHPVVAGVGVPLLLVLLVCLAAWLAKLGSQRVREILPAHQVIPHQRVIKPGDRSARVVPQPVIDHLLPLTAEFPALRALSASLPAPAARR